MGAREGWKKMQKKGKKNVKNNFFCLEQISKCDTCFYTHFSRAFQKYSFQICSFSHKKFMGYILDLYFYTLRTFYRPVLYPMHKKVSKMRVLWQKKQEGGAPNVPPACLGLIIRVSVWRFLIKIYRSVVCSLSSLYLQN